jgi:site-specific recombinase XerD
VGRTALEDFAHHLARAERSPLTIKNYRCDLAAFASWFRDTTGDELTPVVRKNCHPHPSGRRLSQRR